MYISIYLIFFLFNHIASMDVMQFENNDDIINSEMEKQRRKLRDISRILDQQHQLLRLIVQKMEIKTEADDVDEGVSPNDLRSNGNTINTANGSHWTSPRIRNKLRAALSFNKGIQEIRKRQLNATATIIIQLTGWFN